MFSSSFVTNPNCATWSWKITSTEYNEGDSWWILNAFIAKINCYQFCCLCRVTTISTHLISCITSRNFHHQKAPQKVYFPNLLSKFAISWHFHGKPINYFNHENFLSNSSSVFLSGIFPERHRMRTKTIQTNQITIKFTPFWNRN